MSQLACPDEAVLSRLARGELARPEHETVSAHVRGCGSCAATLGSLVDHSTEDSLPLPPGDLSTRTRALQGRLVAAAPSDVENGSRSAAIPRETPLIPGLGPLEPRSRGGMGIVYRAEDLTLKRPVAVKVLWPDAAGSATAWARAKREALVLARISHANVVAVHAAGEAGCSPYLVMEWVEGPSLQQRLAADLPTPRQAARIVRDLARALETVHALGIVHRDIKPDNVLLAGSDATAWEHCVPKLADFGLARPAEISQQLTQDAAALGTPAFMAPEQTGLAAELGEIGPAADIHGLGGLAFALLTGRPPFEAATAAASLQRAARGDVSWPVAARQLPQDLKAIVEKCLEREPRRRYGSAAELGEDLHRFCEGLAVRARAVSPLRRLFRAIRRRPAVAVAIGLSGLFAGAALGGFAYHRATIAGAASRIDRSERLAERNAGVATRTMGRLTGELVEQMIRRSRPDDQSHLEFLRQVREEFFQWPLGDDPVESLEFRVTGLRRVAGLFSEVSQYEDALACHELSLEVLDSLAARRPKDSQLITERLHSLHGQRSCLYHLRRMDEAVTSARRSVALLEQAPADLPERDRELVRAMLDLGIFLHEERQEDEGAVMIDEALARMSRLRKARPDEISLVEQQAHALFTAQLCAGNADRTDDCRRWLEELTDEIGGFLSNPQAAALSAPQRSFLTKMAGIGFNQLARLAHAAGRWDEALALLEQQRQLCVGFVASLSSDEVDPVHKELVAAELQAAALLRERGRDAEAQVAVDRAGLTAALLLEKQPGVWDHAALQGTVFERQADLAAARGDATAAAEWFRKVIALVEPHLATPAVRKQAEALIRSARAGLLAGTSPP